MASTISITHAQSYILLLCLVACTVRTGGENPPPERKKVAVEGVVNCKVCARDPNNSFHHVSALAPLEGAVVKLQCNNTRRSWEEMVKTGTEGGFLLRTTKVTSWGVHKCKLFLVASPRPECMAPADHPYFDNTPWKSGFELIKSNTTSNNSDEQYYTSARPLLYFYYWPDCM